MPSDEERFSPGARVRQAYSAYLDSLYHGEYYKTMNSDVTTYARHFDFVIGLSAALSGGSGLGILGSPWMAVPCSLLTGASVVLTVAKQSYDWPAKSNFAAEMLEKNGRVAGKLKRLVEDIQATRKWTPEFEKQFSELRSEIDNMPQNKFPQLKLATRERLQDDIVRRETPKECWKPPQ
jgi:hypothetical protein